MSILTQEELKKRKEEARDHEIRQNVKSHCMKIQDGIRNNGSMSGNRAIWELFQNAGDLSDCADIKITLTNDSFVFAHKGKPFTFDSLCSLVKQISSQEKENDDTVGQYGTGFLTTHTFSKKITVKGSMQISKSPDVYVDIDDFTINREHFYDLQLFIDDMTAQIKAVEKLMDREQKSVCREWTELNYALTPETYIKAKTAIDEAIKLMPYVLTFNDNIGSCKIDDISRNISIKFTKEPHRTSSVDLHCTRIHKYQEGLEHLSDCYYLELHEGKSRIILPLKTETDVYDLKDTPRLFVHFPLIGDNHFGVNFLFHSHLFTPNEPRNNIIVPSDKEDEQEIAVSNRKILGEMTKYLWHYLECHVESWSGTIDMASLHIEDHSNGEETEQYYKDLKESWAVEFSKLKLIDVDGIRYTMEDSPHPVVLSLELEQFISDDQEHNYLSTIYPYAKACNCLVPRERDLIKWSQIIAEWDESKEDRFLSFERIVRQVSTAQGNHLHDILQMIVDAGHTEFFGKYALLPNRESQLMRREDLRNAKNVSKELYELVKRLNPTICMKMVDKSYADIVELTPYTRQDLRGELNSFVKDKEAECWRCPQRAKPYDGEFERALIDLCSTYTSANGNSKRNKLMPIICRFEGIGYCERLIPAAEDDAKDFDLYRQIFLSLVENEMMKVAMKDADWVEGHWKLLISFVDYARGDDYKGFCTRYAIYPNMTKTLCLPTELKKENNVGKDLFNLYETVIGCDLREKCVAKEFESFFEDYYKSEYQYTSANIANEIQSKLSAYSYQDPIVLDIIDKTESEGAVGTEWQLLFKDIYAQRQSIRYKLGTDEERKAINRMMKQKNPLLLQRMADVAERNDANQVIEKLNETISEMEREAYLKKLGDFVERHIQRFLTEELKPYGIEVLNEQGGQDLVISKSDFNLDYFVEIKSRWENRAAAIMSSTQFKKAVANADRYSLISTQMWNFDRQRIENEEQVGLNEFLPLIRVCNNIGELEAELHKRIESAFIYDEGKIHAEGNYEVHVPQSVCEHSFNDLIVKIKNFFS